MKRAVILAAAALVSAGCFEEVPGANCRTDEECKGGVCGPSGVCVGGGADGGGGPDGGGRADAGPRCQKDEECGKCEACREGKCVKQAAGEDLKEECPAAGCATGSCDGAGGCGLEAAGKVCREAAGDCDVAEECTGSAAECPADEYAAATVECRAAAGACDVAEHCTGSAPACPADEYVAATVECRKAAGDCDVAERCSGSAPACPADEYAAATVECRAAAGACDVAEKCTGSGPDCPSDEKQAEGHECEAEKCVGTAHTPRRTCDGSGACRVEVTDDCAPYKCGATACLTTCGGGVDCTTGVCDVTSWKCAEKVTPVDCQGAAGALQAAITACAGGSRCYLQVKGTCEKVTVENKDVYVDGGGGGIIDPTSDGPAVSVVENGTAETTRVVLAHMKIHGATGASGHGVECIGMGGGSPEVVVALSELGGTGGGESNAGAGISATNATVSVSGGTVQSNAGAGISASGGTVSVSGGTVQNNGGIGISLNEAGFQVKNSIVARNGLVNVLPGVDVHMSTALAAEFRGNTAVGNGGGGMSCSGAKGKQTAIVGSLFWNPGMTEVTDCVVGTGSDVPGSQDSCGNGDASEPGFVKLLPPGADFHLKPGSACVDKLVCDPSLTEDFDGDSRPQPAGGKCDVGADEVQ